MDSPNKSRVKIFLFILLALLIIGGVLAFYAYDVIFGHHVHATDETIITIPSGASSDEVGTDLQNRSIIDNASHFSLIANQMNYKVTPGKYKIEASVKNYRHLIRTLQGNQLAINLTFHNFRLKEQLAGYLGSKIETDSAEFASLLNDTTFLKKYGYTPETIMALFIPNTYQVYWNCTAEQFFDRMQKEHRKFWSDDRLKKAEALGLTPTEVYTLASIVESESQYKPERKRIAGVYLNRLNTKGWLLEADPTVIFAVGDFNIKRVLNKHLEFDSPYNTYKYPGLPPGPIYMASINSIDAVLDAEKHEYMFFCAKPPEEGMPTSHAFAKTLRQHQNNARAYWAWLRKNR